MGSRVHVVPRCGTCRMHVGLCFCAKLPSITTRTRIVLVTHRTEDRKSTNTGRLALGCLPNATAVVRGVEGSARPTIPIAEGSEPLLLFPDGDVLAARPSDAPVTLIVPDGTWRQAQKVRGRMPELAGVPTVCTPPGAPSRYRLRRETYPDWLCTIEAIARALGVLEGPEVQTALEAVLDEMVARTLWVKGEVREVPGIPESAERHDPWSAVR